MFPFLGALLWFIFHRMVGCEVLEAETHCPSGVIKGKYTLDEVTIMSFNVNYLFRNNTGDHRIPWYTTSIEEEHFTKVLNVLQQCQGRSDRKPSVFVLQSLQDCKIVKDLEEGLSGIGLEIQSYPDAIENLGVLSEIKTMDQLGLLAFHEFTEEYPVKDSVCPPHSGNDFSGIARLDRHFYTFLDIQDIPLFVLSVDLIEGPFDDENCFYREAQAKIITRIVKNITTTFNQKHSDLKMPVLILGTFNDFDDTVDDYNLNLPISNVMKTIREDLDLTNVLNRENKVEQQDSCYSFFDDELIGLVDHILVSDFMTTAVTEAASEVNLFEKDFTISNHWPVSISINLRSLEDAMKSGTPVDMGVLIIVVVCVPLCILVVIVLLCVILTFWFVWMKHKKKKRHYTSINYEGKDDLPKVFSIQKKKKKKVKFGRNMKSSDLIKKKHFTVDSFKVV